MTGEFAIAVHALVFLYHKGNTQSSEALAENVCTNPARVRKVLARLKKAELVATKEGLNGGYQAVERTAQINLEEICRALEIDVVSAGWRSGNPEMTCMVASGMAGVMEDIYGELNELCRQRLAQITIGGIEGRIFCRERQDGEEKRT